MTLYQSFIVIKTKKNGNCQNTKQQKQRVTSGCQLLLLHRPSRVFFFFVTIIMKKEYQYNSISFVQLLPLSKYIIKKITYKQSFLLIIKLETHPNNIIQNYYFF